MDIGTTLAYTDIFLFISCCYLLRRILRGVTPVAKTEEDELKKKAAEPRGPITAEQISGVLEAHRTAGTLWGPKHVIVCYCGQQFDDDRGEGLKDMRMHTAKEIEKLQKT